MIDVRAPVEFALGTLPGAINVPIMDDAQRAAVGTTYKTLGKEEAVRLGHELVSGAIKESRLREWSRYIAEHPNAVIFCFRGGLRSKITQSWLAEVGIHRPLIEGGYKGARQFLRDTIDQYSRDSFVILSGPTGSAKTQVLNRAASFYPSLDLEALARHRGSAFGAMEKPQPTQINFENTIATSFLHLAPERKSSPILIEDESRLIGRCAIPETLFNGMRASGLIYLEESFEQRVENILQDYVAEPLRDDSNNVSALFGKFKNSIQMISRKLGGVRTQEILQDLKECEEACLKDPQNLHPNRAWIAKLLKYYYDPAYSRSFQKRNPRILMRGGAGAVMDYLRNQSVS